jgi:hypothetical protein
VNDRNMRIFGVNHDADSGGEELRAEVF